MNSSIALTMPGTRTAGWSLHVSEPTAQSTEPDPALDEAALVAAARDGRPGAFDQLVERHPRAVYQLCYRFVNNHQDASDLTQDVFLRAFRGLQSFRGQSSVATWLYRIAVNVCLNRVGAKKPPMESIEVRQHVDTHHEPPPERLLRAERSARVRAAVAALPDKQRTVLVLRVYHELSHQQIAEIVGTSVGAVKANVFHALQNLKKRLASEQP
jgi:RNA polymerase sigma-70 factor (ECF subfamily)